MGKSSVNKRPACFIKGYLPVRFKLPEPGVGGQDGGAQDETFFYVKEHRESNSKRDEGGEEGSKRGGGSSSSSSSSTTLFIANAPVIPGVKTKILLKSLLGRFGDVDRITLVDNPRRKATYASTNTTGNNLIQYWASTDLHQFYPTFLPPIHGGSEKFAHAVFATSQQMKRTLKGLTQTMTDEKTKANGIQKKKKGGGSSNNQLPGLELTKLEVQMLREESERLLREEMGEDDSDDEDFNDGKKKEAEAEQQQQQSGKGILALAKRYRSSMTRCFDREALMAKSNEVMAEYEDTEEAQRLAREAAANQPDEDGFITVVSSSKGVEGGKQMLEQDQGGGGKQQRRRNQKRNRKKKESIGATELQDFYRFQRKETRKRTLQDLRIQFEEDLKKVKKMKEEQQYKPF